MPFYTKKVILLPRQARGKHRESTKKERRFRTERLPGDHQASRYCLPRGISLDLSYGPVKLPLYLDLFQTLLGLQVCRSGSKS
jgi:hypothetical protein